MKYKSRKSYLALNEIKDPLNIAQNKSSTFSYIREEYSKIYKNEKINLVAANEITKEAPQVTGLQNSLLIQEISLEEIRNMIRSLLNNKSPGSDGLTYEFYKLTEEVITPLLHNLFNQVLLSGLLPKSWCKNLIILIPKKSSDLENLNNWRPISLVNSDAKIFMKILANRLNTIC